MQKYEFPKTIRVGATRIAGISFVATDEAIAFAQQQAILEASFGSSPETASLRESKSPRA